MCRNIVPLNNLEPAVTPDEVRAAALQYVRKVAGTTRPSRANAEVFERAVDEIAHATMHLLAGLVTTAPPRDREVEADKRRARSQARYAIAAARGSAASA
ncbi:DUF2277 domain-containing protein [Actinotalea fermentans]|uniref:DUF2277 domain-containing protein n=1 Tax=Actinotalea fermentans TaxID=43671 RepID=A0A511YXX0_9CELL|nr:DUF2277 domain-containing protein [Actinotalea fermentans]KGM15822.1 hypothetical protein N867_05285 [Actinotalea fermentans ATCC 43279 = JCM 9966 = DSM 3133]GEN80055.1 hypothetical protein AFE02nite_17890 [Actinotalea fermentans]